MRIQKEKQAIQNHPDHVARGLKKTHTHTQENPLRSWFILKTITTKHFLRLPRI